VPWPRWATPQNVTRTGSRTHRWQGKGHLRLPIDGTERRRQRPQDPARQKAHYSGKKKVHTDKNLVLV